MNDRESDGVTDDLRHSGMVERYSTWPTLTRQTVGEHCWQIYRIYCELWGYPPGGATAYYIMHHDSAELITGDPPYPFKKNNPEVAEAYKRADVEAYRRLGVDSKLFPTSDAELARVKVCDLLEMTDHGMLEREMGNLHAVPIVLRTQRAALLHAKSTFGHSGRALVYQYLQKRWQLHFEVLIKAGSLVDASSYGPNA